MRASVALLIPLLVGLTTEAEVPERGAPRWGSFGHEIAARAAVGILPAELPTFFRAAGDQLVYLAPEPDRWRDASSVEMDRAWSYDHYVNLETLPEGALDAPDRFDYLQALGDAGIGRPARDAGLLPFRIVELQQRLANGWRLWHAESDPRVRSWIEARIITDAGVLGHYVTDASQPHHTTIHFNGWNAEASNPDGFTEARDFHGRFEHAFVSAHVVQRDIDSRMPSRPALLDGGIRPAVLDFIRTTHGTVGRLYELERDVGFHPDGPLRTPTRDFTADRLAAGASILASLWWSAWVEGSA